MVLTSQWCFSGSAMLAGKRTELEEIGDTAVMDIIDIHNEGIGLTTVIVLRDSQMSWENL